MGFVVGGLVGLVVGWIFPQPKFIRDFFIKIGVQSPPPTPAAPPVVGPLP